MPAGVAGVIISITTSVVEVFTDHPTDESLDPCIIEQGTESRTVLNRTPQTLCDVFRRGLYRPRIPEL